MFLIVGLGNPGEKYEKTRHNAGRLVLEYFMENNYFSSWEKDKFANALYTKGEVLGQEVGLLSPETFMNNSGQSVVYAQKNNEIDSENIIVIYDDLDLPLGEFKISFDKGAGGHNGIKSIENHLKTKKFIRIRVGISPTSIFGNMKRPGSGKAEKFVLGGFSTTDFKKLEKVSGEISEALDVIIKNGRVKAMNKFN